MKSPIVYYGWKATLASDILLLFPNHTTYCEPFVGWGSLYFAKEPSPHEILNDKLNRVTNFYQTIKTEFGILRYLIQQTPYSRQAHKKASYILKHAEYYNPIRVARAFRVSCNMSFSWKIFGGYAYEKKKNGTSKRIINKKKRFNKQLFQRLECTDIENNDAVSVIQSRDHEQAFFYIDPPYIDSDCWHYKGYTLADFKHLLHQLQHIKGKFLMSSYPHEVLAGYAKTNNWYQMTHTRKIAVHSGIDKEKTEVLTANFDIHELRDAKVPHNKQNKRQKVVHPSLCQALPSEQRKTMNENYLWLGEFKNQPLKAIKSLKEKPTVLLSKNAPVAVLVSLKEYGKYQEFEKIKKVAEPILRKESHTVTHANVSPHHHKTSTVASVAHTNEVVNQPTIVNPSSIPPIPSVENSNEETKTIENQQESVSYQTNNPMSYQSHEVQQEAAIHSFTPELETNRGVEVSHGAYNLH